MISFVIKLSIVSKITYMVTEQFYGGEGERVLSAIE